MFALILCSVLAAQPPEVTEPAPKDSTFNRFEIFAGVMGGARPQGAVGGGGVGLIALDVALTRWFRPEVMVGFGAYSGPADLVTAFRIGAQLVWPTDARLKPLLWVALAHNHETGFDDAKANPVSSALGLSENGVNHRTGITAGLGISYELPRGKEATFAGRLTARLAWTELLGVGPPGYLDALVGVGVTF
jgi:hypothetical protein